MNTLIQVFDKNPHKSLLEEIDNIALELNGIKLNYTQKCGIVGLCMGWSPSKIASKIVKKKSYLRTELSTKLYKYIYVLLEKKGIYQKQKEEKASYKKIHQGLVQLLGQFQNSLNISNSAFGNCITPSVRAKTLINIAQAELLNPVKVGLLSLDLARLNEQINDADKLCNEQKYEKALIKYQSLINHIFAWYPSEIQFLGVLVKMVSCYNALEAYEDVEDLSYFALKYIKHKKARSDLYSYRAGVYHEKYRRTNNPQYLRIAESFYLEAKEIDQNDSVLLWDFFDLYVEAQKREHNGIDYTQSMILAWNDFLKQQQNPNSNYERYKHKIIQDKDRILKENPNNQWLYNNLKQI